MSEDMFSFAKFLRNDLLFLVISITFRLLYDDNKTDIFAALHDDNKKTIRRRSEQLLYSTQEHDVQSSGQHAVNHAVNTLLVL